MPEDFDVSVPDIPLPETPAASAEISDSFQAGFKFAFVGLGQGGGRIAAAFAKLGYARVCAINTAQQDLAALALPTERKLCLGETGGAGKNPAMARVALAQHREDALDFMRRSFGTSIDRVFVCAGGGGGTGAGMTAGMVEVAEGLQEALKCPGKKVGVILALPKTSEGARAQANALRTLSEVLALVDAGRVSPLCLVDNEKIGTLYPSLAVEPFWGTANASIASLFHLFNTICVRDSSHTSFDRADLLTVLDSGLITFGAAPVAKWQDATDLSHAVRHTLARNILTGGIDLSTGSVAAAIVIAHKDILATIPQLHLDHAFEQLTRLMGPNSTVHRGIYRGDKPGLVVYSAIGGLKWQVASHLTGV